MQVIFNLCCQLCTYLASMLGLTYGEFCILAFCYLQPLVVLVSAILNFKRLFGKATIVLNLLYLCFHAVHYPITTKSFFVIYKDLHKLAAILHLSYVELNLLLYILIPVVLVVVNLYQWKRGKRDNLKSNNLNKADGVKSAYRSC